jgi:hypothetical protein
MCPVRTEGGGKGEVAKVSLSEVIERNRMPFNLNSDAALKQRTKKLMQR